MGHSIYLPENAKEVFIGRGGDANSIEASSLREKLLAYWRLTYWVWILLGLGYLIFLVSAFTCFRPASSGAILVALSVIAESCLLTARWQSYPAKSGSGYTRIWISGDAKKNLHLTTGGMDLENRILKLLIFQWITKKSLIYQIVILSRSSDQRFYPARWASTNRAGATLLWDMSETTRRITTAVSIYITISIILGTIVWGYYDFVQQLIPSLACT